MTAYVSDPDMGMSKEEQILKHKRHALGRRIRTTAWTTGTLCFAITVVGLVVGRLIT